MPSDSPRLLDLLRRLEVSWRRHGAPIASSLQPGLTDARIDELMAPTGLRLPRELRTWWRWHNGSAEEHDIGPGGWLFAPLERALELREYHSTMTESIDATIPALVESYWHPSWFPITERLWKSNHLLYVDTAVPDGAPSPVLYHDEMWEECTVERAASFTDAVALWVELLELDAYYWNAHDEYWDDVYERIPPNYWSTRLI